MHSDFPAAVPEIPVSDIDRAVDYYQNHLGFKKDWGGADGGIAGQNPIRADHLRRATGLFGFVRLPGLAPLHAPQSAR